MALNDAAKNIGLDAIGDAILFMGLHNGDPSTTGANEIAGGSPAYARQPIDFNAAATGNLDSSLQPTFDVPATTVQYVSYWSAVTGGIFYGSKAVTNEVFAAQGQYTIDDVDISLT